MINARAETAAVKPSFKRPLHERMPVILRKVDEALWLDPNAKAGTVAALLVPFADDALKGLSLSRRVDSPANDTPAVAKRQ
jgi:putative SOS response-associated peptidase YedK